MSLDPQLVAELGCYSSPSVINALRNLRAEREYQLPFDRNTVHCIAPSLGVSIGFAVTARVISGFTEVDKIGEPDPALRLALYEHVLSQPGPRFLVVQYEGETDGPGCYLGEVHANVFRRLGCVAALSNGPVRDLPEMEAAGFQTFASGVSVGGSRLALVEVGSEVSVAGKLVRPGDLLHGDQHGILQVPTALAAELPGAIRAVARYEQHIIEQCHADDFSAAKLSAAWDTGPP